MAKGIAPQSACFDPPGGQAGITLPRRPARMRHFALFIDNEVRGPLSEYEVQDLIAAGTVNGQTLCAPAGSTEWEPLANHFTFGSTLKLNRAPAVEKSEAELAAEANRLDPEVRRSLLMYGLADGATVDQISPAQAEAALAGQIARIQAARRLHLIAGWSALVLAGATGATLTLTDTPVARALGTAALSFTKDDPRQAELARRFETELRTFEKLRADALAASFAAPTGGTPARAALLARLKVNPATGFNLRGEVDTAPLAGLVGKWNVKLDPAVRVFVLPATPPETVARKIEEQSNVLDAVLAPVLDDAGFDSLRAEVVRGFPEFPAAPESARLKTEVEAMKLPELKAMIERVEFRAQAAEKAPATKDWSPQLRAFAGQLRDLLARVQTNVNPVARGRRWSEFNAGPGAELAAWVLGADAREAKVDDKGAFVLDETAKLDAAAAATRVLVTTQLNNDTVYLAWGSKFLSCRTLDSHEIPKEQFLAREEYKVVDKPATGGRRCLAKARVGGRELAVERVSPRWHFLTVAREKDPDSLVVAVDADTYAKFAVGQVVPFETLAALQVFARPVESPVPAPLSPAE